MHPAFATIEFGPFQSEYHQSAVDANFREVLSNYLVAELLPQVDEPFESTWGSLRAAYDDPKYCGPNSVVKDVYSLKFEFRRPSGVDAISIDLAYSTKQRSFAPRYRGKKLYLATAARKIAKAQKNGEIQKVCESILRGDIKSATCPCCSAELRIMDVPAMFDVSCPERCFNYNFHRNPKTGEFEHGHFFTSP